MWRFLIEHAQNFPLPHGKIYWKSILWFIWLHSLLFKKKTSSYKKCRMNGSTWCTADINTSNAELNPICHLPALLGAHHILHVSRKRVNTTAFATSHPAELTVQPTFQGYVSVRPEDESNTVIRGHGGTRWRSWLGHCATSRKVYKEWIK